MPALAAAMSWARLRQRTRRSGVRAWSVVRAVVMGRRRSVREGRGVAGAAEIGLEGVAVSRLATRARRRRLSSLTGSMTSSGRWETRSARCQRVPPRRPNCSVRVAGESGRFSAGWSGMAEVALMGEFATATTSGSPGWPETTRERGMVRWGLISPCHDERRRRSMAGSLVFQTRVPGGTREKLILPRWKERRRWSTEKTKPPCSRLVSPPVSKTTPSPGLRAAPTRSSSTQSEPEAATWPTMGPRFLAKRPSTSRW